MTGGAGGDVKFPFLHHSGAPCEYFTSEKQPRLRSAFNFKITFPSHSRAAPLRRRAPLSASASFSRLVPLHHSSRQGP